MDGFSLSVMFAFFIGIFIYFTSGDYLIEVNHWEYDNVAEVAQKAKQNKMKDVTKLISKAMEDNKIYKNEYENIMSEFSKAKVLVEIK